MQILQRTEEMIHPIAASSHPTLHRLSEVDQISAPVCQLFFYKQGPPSSQVLKSSLSKTLAFFYPVAGRLVQRTLECQAAELQKKAEGQTKPGIGGKLEAQGEHRRMVAIGGRKDVACLDQGVLFVEAWADSALDTYFPDFQPHADFLAFLPFDSKYEDVLLKAQVIKFSCGGMCLAMVFLHNIFDGASFAHFMECWVEFASGKENLTRLPYISPIPLEELYISRELFDIDLEKRYSPQIQFKLSSHTTSKNKIFHFTPSFIDNLKNEASDDTCKYSTFECVAAFIWRNVTLARGNHSNEEVHLVYTVNARGRLKPSLPPSFLGNVIHGTQAIIRGSDLVERKLSHTTNLIRKATSKVTDDYLRKFLMWSTEQASPNHGLPINNEPQKGLFLITWVGFPLCEFNFGWGNPICCRTSPCISFDLVMLLPSSLGKGHIDVLVALDEECMQKFESFIS